MIFLSWIAVQLLYIRKNGGNRTVGLTMTWITAITANYEHAYSHGGLSVEVSIVLVVSEQVNSPKQPNTPDVTRSICEEPKNRRVNFQWINTVHKEYFRTSTT